MNIFINEQIAKKRNLFVILFKRTKKNVIFFKEISAYFYTLMGESITLFVDMTLFIEILNLVENLNSEATIISIPLQFENTRIN